MRFNSEILLKFPKRALQFFYAFTTTKLRFLKAPVIDTFCWTLVFSLNHGVGTRPTRGVKFQPRQNISVRDTIWCNFYSIDSNLSINFDSKAGSARTHWSNSSNESSLKIHAQNICNFRLKNMKQKYLICVTSWRICIFEEVCLHFHLKRFKSIVD